MNAFTVAQIAKIWAWGLVLYPPFRLYRGVFGRTPYDRVRAAQAAWGTYVTRRCFRARLRVRGQENLPARGKGYIILSNHKSFADIPILASVLGGPSFLLREGIGRIPLVGWWAREHGVSFNREDLSDRQRVPARVVAFARENSAMVVFVEGTRQTGEEMGKIHAGMILHAVQERVPLLLTAHFGSQHVVPLGNRRVNPGRPVAVRIGRFLQPHEADYSVEAALDGLLETYAACRARYHRDPG